MYSNLNEQLAYIATQKQWVYKEKSGPILTKEEFNTQIIWIEPIEGITYDEFMKILPTYLYDIEMVYWHNKLMYLWPNYLNICTTFKLLNVNNDYADGIMNKVVELTEKYPMPKKENYD